MSKKKRKLRNLYGRVRAASRSGFVPGNRITLLRNGAAYFPAIEAAIDRARCEVYLETYIYQHDATGERIAAALKRAVQRGVAVHVLVDGYGSRDLPQTMRDRMRVDGIRLRIYQPNISPWTFQRERLRRMHRKIVVVDREIAFVGGINVVGDRQQAVDLLPHYDYAVAVEGPLVEQIRRSARRLWTRAVLDTLRRRSVRASLTPASTLQGGTMSAAFLVRDNFRHRRDIEAAYLRAIKQAKSEVIMASAYFLPGVGFRHALVRAARRGVRVTLLLQGKSDHPLQRQASQVLYGNFLAAGIEIYEYHRSFLHAKVAVIDVAWATVGSSNIDPFSLLLSREANVVVNDDAFAANLRQSLLETMEADGQRISPDSWERQPVALRFVGWLVYGWLRLMTGISGYARPNNRGVRR